MDCRVFLNYSVPLQFKSISHLIKYAQRVGINSIQRFPQWDNSSDTTVAYSAEIDYMLEEGEFKHDIDIGTKVRILAITVTNNFDKPVTNFNLEADVKYRNKITGEIQPVHYGESVKHFISPSEKLMFLFPVNFKNQTTSIEMIESHYITLYNEKIKFVSKSIDQKSIEVYSIDGKEINPSFASSSDKHSSMVIDLNKLKLDE